MPNPISTPPYCVLLVNQMNFVWVLKKFHVTFIESRVDPFKVVKIVQPIYVSFFDVLKYKPYHLALILGKANSYSKSKLIPPLN